MLRNCLLELLKKDALVLHVLITITTASCVSIAQAAGKQPQAKPGDADFVVQQDYQKIDEVLYRPMAVELLLPNGNVLTFSALRDGRGEIIALGMNELRRAKNNGISSIAALSGAKLPDIFHALSKPGTRMPSFLRLVQTKPTYSRPQGWARDLVLAGPKVAGGVGNPRLTCPELGWTWNGFREDVLSKGLPLSFLSEGDGPATKPNHWGLPTNSPDRFRLLGRVDDVQDFYGNVLWCATDTTLQNEPPLGGPVLSEPRVIWEVCPTAPTGSCMTDSKRLTEQGEENKFTLQIPEPQNPLGTGFKVILRIEYPFKQDKFYIGATWSKISGTLTVGP